MTGFELMLFIAANKLNICECVSDTECACMLFVAAFSFIVFGNEWHGCEKQQKQNGRTTAENAIKSS